MIFLENLANTQFPRIPVFNTDPPFREARLKIGKQYHLGAVEIHVNSSGWYSHHHEGNPDYNEVVLHVVLYHNGQREIKRQDGRIVPELELAPLLSKEPSTSETEAKNHLKKLSEFLLQFRM